MRAGAAEMVPARRVSAWAWDLLHSSRASGRALAFPVSTDTAAQGEGGERDDGRVVEAVGQHAGCEAAAGESYSEPGGVAGRDAR